MALYMFNEHHDNTIVNLMDSTNNLIIPDRYFALHPIFLSSVTRDYQPTWEYWHDIGVNIAGFIPYGFFVAIFWSEVRTIKHPVAAALFFGLLLSLMIEILQFFLPTRSSGTTDLITNTLGTVIGVMIYRSKLSQSLLARVRRQFGTSDSSAEGIRRKVENSASDIIAPAEEPASMSAPLH